MESHNVQKLWKEITRRLSGAKKTPAVLPNKIPSQAYSYIYIYIFSPDITEMTINQSGYLDVRYPTRGFSKNEVLNYSALEWWCKGYVAGKDKLQNKYFPLTAIHTAAFMQSSRERSKRYFSMHRTEISAFCCVFLSQIIPVLTCNRKTCSVSLNLINIFSCVYSCLAFAF